MVDQLAQRALPGHCAFCLGETLPETPWCLACEVALPWNEHACPGCAEPLPGQALVEEGPRRCGRCLIRPPAFDMARAPLRYEAEVARLVQAFKFSASPRAGTLLLTLLEAGHEVPVTSGAGSSRPEALIPVPLHPRRARERGFDQADWLGRRLARRLDLPYMMARRVRMTPTQRGLARPSRLANLKDAFLVERPLPAHVVLLDDVMTTGATFEALARVCRTAGAKYIEAWAVARTPRR
ncbi:ComF family protein [Halomonas sp. YLGW01]|uniref:ComF family protein n=1 Tax=Halomonas sp. YLGW01 TaxID=2773308 RepID=UPI001F5B1140|nr:ComF family protein [Halomonas sp. YLGW01]